MTIEQWLEDAKSDAYRRKLPELADMLDGLAARPRALRAADWNEDAAGPPHQMRQRPEFDMDGTRRLRRRRRRRRPSEPLAHDHGAGPRIACGEITSERITEEALERHQQAEPAPQRLHHDHGRRGADGGAGADKAIAAGRHLGPLHGIPISLKDLIDLAGVPTTAASRLREGCMAAADAPVTTHLRQPAR